MKKLIKSAIFLSALLFGHFTFLHAQPNPAMNVNHKTGAQRTYRINKKSVLKLEGKTNVSGFTCDCKEEFSPQQFIVEGQGESKLSQGFNSTTLKLRIKSLDCGNKMMNKDLQKALNADDHPYITIELKKVEQDKCNRLTELKDWVKMKALTKISLNGQSKDYWINITAKKSGPNQYRFIGSKSLNMSDFCVVPPVAMMGMVKAQDAITIHLDLDISVE